MYRIATTKYVEFRIRFKKAYRKNINRYEDLKIYINSLNSIMEVQKVTWDTLISTITT